MVLVFSQRARMPQRGFSLIEVIISAAMLGIGLAAVMTAYGNASNLGAHQARVTTAMHLAEAELERDLLLYPDADELKAVAHPPQHFDVDGVPTAGASFYALTRAVAAGPIPKTRRITVTVSWSEPTGAQTLTLSTHRT